MSLPFRNPWVVGSLQVVDHSHRSGRPAPDQRRDPLAPGAGGTLVSYGRSLTLRRDSLGDECFIEGRQHQSLPTSYTLSFGQYCRRGGTRASP